MAIKKTPRNDKETGSGNVIQLTLPGLIFLCAALLIVSSGLTFFLVSSWSRPPQAHTSQQKETFNTAATDAVTPPWGNLITYDIQLERPEEYVALEINSNQPPTWMFKGMNPEQTRATLVDCGFTSEQVANAIAPERIATNSGNTVVHPTADLLLGLSPTVRSKLYLELAKSEENHYMKYPFVFSGKSFETIIGNKSNDKSTVALVQQLLYPRGDDQCFSDFELVMSKIPEETNRLQLVRALSRQSAVLARLKITPDTDIEKILGYWTAAPGVRVKDARPLLESLKRTPEGGTISLLYFLPQFARQRLYTFPMPPKPGDPRIDCHWSTMNFFNEVPDNRFNDASYTAKYLDQNYYPVAKANAYGDLIFLLDDKGNALHSAVYIASDIVFTKNGDNYLQPWVFMRLKDLTGLYAAEPPLRMLVYRNRRS